ncbi:MAG: hypothetical protein M0P09_02550, partial [Acholeplasmataceae bacterium]|nr:hypothetical protein [Acholeplasmataceae bacterium]
KRAQKANIKVRVLKVYMVNIQAIKEASINKLSLILDTYNQKYKDIFIMYFIERKAIEDIAIIAKYNRRHIDRIIAKLKEDLEENYPPDKK